MSNLKGVGIKKIVMVLAAVAVVAAAGVLVYVRRAGTPQVRAKMAAALPQDTSGYARVEGPQPITFPAAFGPQPDYQTEWWYYTGNLDTADGRHFGFELTFFRNGIAPPSARADRPSDWATTQVYMAHFTVTDVTGKRFQAFERFERGAAGLAGAQAAPYHVGLDDWSVQQTGPSLYRLHAAQGELSVDLQLKDLTGPVLQGDRGYMQTGPSPSNAALYFSQPRLQASGTIKIGAASYSVQGLSWMDREISTQALAADQVGWDWFALQLDDGSELMLYQVRKTDGSVDPFSSAVLIGPDGQTQHLKRQDYVLTAGSTWRSPFSGATYPASWKLEIPSAGLSLDVKPYLADQELPVSVIYWEGAVRVTGQRAGKAVSGSGYVELTGYAGSIRGRF